MRRRGGVGDEALRIAQIVGDPDQLRRRLPKRNAPVLPPSISNAIIVPPPLHLAHGESRLRVVGAAGIEHPGRRPGCAPCTSATSSAVAAPGARRADRQRFQTLQQHPGIERRHGRPGLTQQIVDVVGDELLGRQDDSAEAASLSVDVLGGRIDHAIRAELQRAAAASAWRTRCPRPASRPPAWAMSATAAMSMISSVGLVGLSRKSTLVLGRTASRHCVEICTRRRAWRRHRSAAAGLPRCSGTSRTAPWPHDMIACPDLPQHRGGDGGHAARGRAGRLARLPAAPCAARTWRRSGWRTANR